MKIALCLVVLSGVHFQCFAETVDDFPLITSCYVQYLNEKGKLHEPLPSTIQPPSSRCRLVVAFFMNLFMEETVHTFTPRVADCMRNESVNGEYFDHLLKRNVYTSLFGEDDERLIRLVETSRNHFRQKGAEALDKCRSNGTDTHKRPSLEDHQRKYCLVKYALDKQLLKLQKDMFDGVNHDLIDLKNVNCTNIIAVERTKTDAQFKDQLTASDCVMNVYENGTVFDWKIDVIVSTDIYYMPGAQDKVKSKIERFLSNPESDCVV